MMTKNFVPVLFLAGVMVFIFSVGTGYADSLTPQETLGKELFFDKISDPDWMSCSECHDPGVGFTGPIPGINKHGAVYRGAVPMRFGNRKPPSAAYATMSPIFFYDAVEGLFVGGNFWDGRATGEALGNPAADQARGPFLNPVEQNNASKEAVLEQVCDAKYAGLFVSEFQKEYPGMDPCDPVNVEMAYDFIAISIAVYEGSSEVNQFSSKFDFYLRGDAELTDQEMAGLTLFNGKAMCSACHISEVGPFSDHPLFTDYTFDNLGVPRNPDNPFYRMDRVLLDNGDPINPMGAAWIDRGLAGFLETRPEWADKVAENEGKHKVPTLRNVDKRYGNGFPKSYSHNGYFQSLKTIVHFYNTRDVKMTCPDPFTTEKNALAMNCWPVPEVPENVNTDELGDLGLTDSEEDAIVAFMATLSDGFDPSDGSGPGHPPKEICNDGIDNDKDGLKDCKDTKDCRRDPACRKCK